MKTTIDIPDDLLKRVVKRTHAKTKRQAVVTALEEYDRRERMADLVKHFGTFKNFMNLDELMELRWGRTKRHGLD